MNKKLLWLILAAFVLANILAIVKVNRKQAIELSPIADQVIALAPSGQFITPQSLPTSPIVTKEAIAKIACPQPLSLADWPIDNNNFQPVSLDWTASQIIREDQQFIAKSYSSGINLAGYFHLASRSCGQNCQEAAIVNAKTGRVIAFGANDDLLSTTGWSFSPTSTLLIINPDSQDRQNPTIYALVEDNGLRRICYLAQ
jgi:hypothetical protein